MPERLKRWLVGALFPYPARLKLALAPLKLIERAGLRPALQRVLPRAFRDWLELLPALNGAGESAPALPQADDGNLGAVAVHRGCVAQVLAGSTNRNAERLLRGAGYRIVELERTVCCGALDLHSGNRPRALAFARAN